MPLPDATEVATNFLKQIDLKKLKRPTLLRGRTWDRICTDPRVKESIAALSTENIVFDVATHETPAVAEMRMLFGTSAFSPKVNRRRKWSTPEFRLLGNTNQTSTFVHECVRCTGQYGKILQHPTYMIRIGKCNVLQALLNVVRFNMFDNRRTITAAEAPNTVITGVFHKQLDRASLLTNPRSNDTTEFPGITFELHSGAKATPGLHTNVPSRFIISGCRSIYDVYAATVELAEAARAHSVSDERTSAKRRRVESSDE